MLRQFTLPFSSSWWGGKCERIVLCKLRRAGFVPWRQKQQFARKGWYLSIKMHAEVILVEFLARPLHIQAAPTFNPQSEDRPSI
jgi:hypothetical protein